MGRESKKLKLKLQVLDLYIDLWHISHTFNENDYLGEFDSVAFFLYTNFILFYYHNCITYCWLLHIIRTDWNERLDTRLIENDLRLGKLIETGQVDMLKSLSMEFMKKFHFFSYSCLNTTETIGEKHFQWFFCQSIWIPIPRITRAQKLLGSLFWSLVFVPYSQSKELRFWSF